MPSGTTPLPLEVLRDSLRSFWEGVTSLSRSHEVTSSEQICHLPQEPGSQQGCPGQQQDYEGDIPGMSSAALPDSEKEVKEPVLGS